MRVERRRSLAAGVSALLLALVFAVAAATRDDSTALRGLWALIALAWGGIALRSALRFRDGGHPVAPPAADL